MEQMDALKAQHAQELETKEAALRQMEADQEQQFDEVVLEGEKEKEQLQAQFKQQMDALKLQHSQELGVKDVEQQAMFDELVEASDKELEDLKAMHAAKMVLFCI